MKEEKNSLITYCGLYCGDCPYGSGEIVNHAANLLDTMNKWSFSRVSAGLAKMFERYKALSDYDTFIKVLHSMMQLTCDATCKEDGGLKTCDIRNCCRDRGLEGCWQCQTFETCSTLSWLKPVHDTSHIKNLRIIKDQGPEQFIKGKKHW